MTEATRPCRNCGTAYQVTPHEFLKRDYKCRDCRRDYNRAYRDQRRANGNPVKSGVCSPEYHKAYDAEYKKRPHVRPTRAKQQRERMKNPEERKKMRVRMDTRNAIRRGELKRRPCEVCGAVKVDAHHDDYSKPLAVRWLCRIHHTEHHAKAKGGAA